MDEMNGAFEEKKRRKGGKRLMLSLIHISEPTRH